MKPISELMIYRNRPSGLLLPVYFRDVAGLAIPYWADSSLEAEIEADAQYLIDSAFWGMQNSFLNTPLKYSNWM